MSGRAYLLDLINRGFIVITLGRFPWTSAEEVSVVKSGVVIAPVSNVLDRARAGNCRLKTRGLRDEPIRHVTAVAVSAHREVVGIGNAIFHQSVDAFQNVLARSRNDLRHDLHQELVTITCRAAVIRLEYQPTVGCGQGAPLIPVSFKAIAISVGR